MRVQCILPVIRPPRHTLASVYIWFRGGVEMWLSTFPISNFHSIIFLFISFVSSSSTSFFLLSSYLLIFSIKKEGVPCLFSFLFFLYIGESLSAFFRCSSAHLISHPYSLMYFLFSLIWLCFV
ncbi:hypothetical protein DFH27DRAFT_294485 [Peziza echinospora]|nr:hypothetical protein DFH27DRAFT_294485 [Peziza echinospora]